jgi:hypothetical protein
MTDSDPAVLGSGMLFVEDGYGQRIEQYGGSLSEGHTMLSKVPFRLFGIPANL